MNDNLGAKLPAVDRWTQPDFMPCIFKKKYDEFPIAHGGPANCPIELNFGNAKLKWENDHWINLNFKHQPQSMNPSKAEIRKLQMENADLQVECEILLHMLTLREMSKVKAQNKLNYLKNEISQKIKKIESQS